MSVRWHKRSDKLLKLCSFIWHNTNKIFLLHEMFHSLFFGIRSPKHTFFHLPIEVLVYVDIDSRVSIHQGKIKYSMKWKAEKTKWFSYSESMANFEAYCLNISSSINISVEWYRRLLLGLAKYLIRPVFLFRTGSKLKSYLIHERVVDPSTHIFTKK